MTGFEWAAVVVLALIVLGAGYVAVRDIGAASGAGLALMRARQEIARRQAEEAADEERRWNAVWERAVRAESAMLFSGAQAYDVVTFTVTMDEFRVLDRRLRYRERPNEVPRLLGMRVIVQDPS